MASIRKLFVFCLIYIYFPTFLGFSQEDLKNDSINKNNLNLYVNCSDCDFDYLRKEITLINFVREPTEAHIYLLESSLSTGSGGEQYSLFFIGQNQYKGITDTILFHVSPDDTEDEIREMMAKRIKAGLIRFVLNTEVINDININYKPTTAKQNIEIDDKWKSWVFSIRNTVSVSGEKSYKYFSINSSLSAEKITEKFKTEFYASNYYSQSNYLIDTQIYITTSRTFSLNNQTVFSLNSHWSAGVSAGIYSSIYSNLRNSYSIAPAIEYNLFPYSEASRRQLRVKYTLGQKYNNYFDTTLYGKISENRYRQSLGIAYSIVQKWGSISASVYGSNYLHDFRKNNLYIYLSTSLRIVKGLSFYNYGYYSIVHDQIELPKYDATPEEVLLRIRALESQYNFYFYAGLSYTFGSVYNNVVNPRFGD